MPQALSSLSGLLITLPSAWLCCENCWHDPHRRDLAGHRAAGYARRSGNSYWGCALAFRMLQRAAPLLSGRGLWDRRRLQVLSGHPGPGVRDTLELVTGCVSEGRFRLEGGPREARCVGDMAYRWRLSDGMRDLPL